MNPAIQLEQVAAGARTRLLLSGNEAVALAAADAGVHVATGYPGTPATEIIERLRERISDRRVFWHTNEKTALEIGLGAALHAEARALVVMKHVGLNVAADAFKSAGVTGLTGALVLVVCDDPGMHSSQNEFDSRRYAAETGTLVLEPADAQEAYDFTRDGFRLAALFGSLVMIRMTTRVCHARSSVEPRDAEPRVAVTTSLEHHPEQYVVAPAFSRPNVQRLFDTEIPRRRMFVERYKANVCMGPPRAKRGIIATGVAYHHVVEVLNDEDVRLLKLGMPLPLPVRLLREFAATVEQILIFEEGRTLHEELGVQRIPGVVSEPRRHGEWTPNAVRQALHAPESNGARVALPVVLPHSQRPANLCSGCPHRAMSFAVKQLGVPLIGDIGCSTLTAFKPLDIMSTALEMGASIPMAEGAYHLRPDTKPVCMIGDGTLLHSGIPGLIGAVENDARITVLVMDNDGIAMTGQQTIASSRGRQVDLAALARSIGVRHVRAVDAHNYDQCTEVLRQAQAEPGVSVVIVRDPCVFVHPRMKTAGALGPRVEVNADRCTQCGQCLDLGCPSISRSPVTGKPVIDDTCVGCGDCIQVCNPCPVQTRVQQFATAFDHQHYEAGAAAIYASNPFAAACGSLCEGHCRTSAIVPREGPSRGQPRSHTRNYAEIEASLARYRPAAKPQTPSSVRPDGTAVEDNGQRQTQPRIAIVGAGPAGLTAARELAAMGCAIELFETGTVAGGMVVSLAESNAELAARVADDVRRILDMPTVKVHYETRLGIDCRVAELADAFEAVLIACGRSGSEDGEVREELLRMRLDFGEVGLRNGRGARLRDNLFAAGDVLGDGKKDLAHAIASGKRAAAEVVTWLQGEAQPPSPRSRPLVRSYTPLGMRYEHACDVLVGSVGGQGGVTTARILVDAFQRAGWDCKTSEIHGLAQRGGPVTVHVRGDRSRVHSPLIEQGQADIGLFLDPNQALRWQHFVSDQGIIALPATDCQVLQVSTLCRSNEDQHDDRAMVDAATEIRAARDALAIVPLPAIPRSETDKSFGVYVLGYASRWFDLPRETWRAAIRAIVPRGAWDSSLAAFERGAHLP